MPLHGELLKLKKFTRAATVRKYLQSSDEPALHLGCGGHNVKGWLNVDKFHAASDTYFDAKWPFPFDDNSFELVFTEHMIEHLDIGKVKRFLSEIFRVMKPGGRCRITCPDLEIYAHAYVNGDQAFFDRVHDAFWPKGKRVPDESWVVKGNGGAFMTGIAKNFWGHRWMYDFDNMRACLDETGFTDISKQQCGQSEHPRLAAMDKPERAYETLYVEATKPV